MMMLLALPGILLLGASVACLVFLPRKGHVHPWVKLPVLESVIPLGIMIGATFGVATLVIAFS